MVCRGFADDPHQRDEVLQHIRQEARHAAQNSTKSLKQAKFALAQANQNIAQLESLMNLTR